MRRKGRSLDDAVPAIRSGINLAKRNIERMKKVRGDWLKWFSARFSHSGANAPTLDCVVVLVFFSSLLSCKFLL